VLGATLFLPRAAKRRPDQFRHGSVPLAAIGSVAMIIGAAMMSWLFIAQGRGAM
jgi:hypothetical protein